MTRRSFDAVIYTLEAVMLVALIVATLAIRRCGELELEAREACAGHPCAEGLEAMLVEGSCVCLEKR